MTMMFAVGHGRKSGPLRCRLRFPNRGFWRAFPPARPAHADVQLLFRLQALGLAQREASGRQVGCRTRAQNPADEHQDSGTRGRMFGCPKRRLEATWGELAVERHSLFLRLDCGRARPACFIPAEEIGENGPPRFHSGLTNVSCSPGRGSLSASKKEEPN